MRIVFALGGNALLERGQTARRRDPARPTSVRGRRGPGPDWPPDHEVVITHGNGPQVGMLALESAARPAT